MAEEQFVGKKIGQIEIKSKIGQGGMGSVYKGMHNFLQKEVAVKFLSKQLCENNEFIDRFMREAQTLAKVEHKNLVRVLDAGEWEGSYYIVMEFIKGKSLGDVLKNTSRVPVGQAITIVKECATGLNAAALKSIIHRDIKPDNIMILDDGGIKVTDFGLAKSLESSMEITQTGQLMGTPHYMSPEQCDGDNVDFRSDMYSLGATFYRIITGKFPYTGNTPFAVMRKHVQDQLTPATSIITDIPKSVSDIIIKMMEKKPEKRYTSYNELCKTLAKLEDEKFDPKKIEETFIEETPVNAGSGFDKGDVGTAPTIVGAFDSPAPKGLPEDGVGTSPTIIQRRKNKKKLIIITAVIFLIAAGIGAAMMFSQKKEDDKSFSSEEKEDLTAVKANEYDKNDQDDVVEKITDEAELIFNKALSKYKEGDTESSLKLFNVVINKYPMSDFSDRSLSYVNKIEKYKRDHESAIRKINQYLSEFQVDKADVLFEQFKLGDEDTFEVAELKEKIESLKSSLNIMDQFIEKGNGYFEQKNYSDAEREYRLAKNKADEIGYNSAEIDLLIASLIKEKRDNEFIIFNKRMEVLLSKFELTRAQDEMLKYKNIFSDRIKYKKLNDSINDVKLKIKEIKDLKVKGLMLLSNGQNGDALEIFRSGKSKATALNYPGENFDTLIDRVKTRMNERETEEKYQEFFLQSKAFLKKGNYTKSLELAQSAYSIKISKESKVLIAKIEKLIEEDKYSSKVSKFKNEIENYINDKNYSRAGETLRAFAGFAKKKEERKYIKDKKKYIEKLLKKSKPKLLVINDTVRGAKMVYIKIGETFIGDDDGPKQCRPRHKVRLTPFYMDVKEVTNKEYELFDPSHKKKRLPNANEDDIPATNITWEEASAYCKWLSSKEGKKYRLPTEAEWEAAAKGTGNIKYSSGSTFKGKINTKSDKPVSYDIYDPNSLGLYNMSGNVWEFCLDWISLYEAKEALDPLYNDPGQFKKRVIRGGSFSAVRPETTSSVYFRNGVDEDKGFRDTGFRCVREE